MAVRAEEIDDRGVVDLDRDRGLVLRYQAGDQAAFDELYRRYYPRLHLYCQRRVGDAHVSEELAQEAFLRALRAMPRFAGDRRFYPWMTVIAQRLCIDHHRHSARVEPSPAVDLGMVDPDVEHLFAAVDHGHLASAMERLAPRHREVLELREQDGCSYQQIAERLEVPITTVEALLHRARKALKREYLAVSRGTRLAGVPVFGALALRVAKLRARVADHTAQQVLPVVGTAAAGLAAAGLVFSPFTATQPPALAAPAPVTARPVALVEEAMPSPFAVTLPATAPASPAAPAAAATPKASTATTAAPAPVLNAGVATVSTGPAATSSAAAANDQQPVQLEVPGADFGVNPAQLVDDTVNLVTGAVN